jgi:hypothetical protein
MSKTVVYSSCSRISCAGAETPAVVLCLNDSELLLSGLNTIEGTLTKVYKSTECCDSVMWRYIVSYDETLLADPSVLLAASDIDGIFCKGCLTTWVDDQIATLIADPITVDDTVTVDLSLSAAPKVLTADVNISAVTGNLISEQVDGIYATYAVDDTETIDLTFSGTPRTLSADIKVSADSGNQVSVNPDGLFVSSTMPTGSTVMWWSSVAPVGWLLVEGGSIGSALSGATVRANADTDDLFAYFWNNLSDALAPVSGGRGASAAADFAANKRLTLPDCRQKFFLYQSAAGTGSVIGDTGGAIDHDHSVPAHYHGMGTGADLNITSSGSHTHDMETKVNYSTNIAEPNEFVAKGLDAAANSTNSTSTAASHIHAAGAFAGRIGLVTGGVDGNAAMTSGDNNPPFIVITAIVKL